MSSTTLSKFTLFKYESTLIYIDSSTITQIALGKSKTHFQMTIYSGHHEPTRLLTRDKNQFEEWIETLKNLGLQIPSDF